MQWIRQEDKFRRKCGTFIPHNGALVIAVGLAMAWSHGQGAKFLGFGFVSEGPFHCLGSALIADRLIFSLGRRPAQRCTTFLPLLPLPPSTALHYLHCLHYLHSPPPPPHKSLRNCTIQIPMGRHSMVIFRKRYILPITSTSNSKAFCPIRPALGPTRFIFSYSSAHTLTTCRRRCSLSPAILEVEKTRPLSSRED